jgi:hypothetical protein
MAQALVFALVAEHIALGKVLYLDDGFTHAGKLKWNAKILGATF